MIQLTRFDGSQFHLNADLIEVVESRPDTHITLVNGHRHLVKEPDVDVIERIVAYQRETGIDRPRRVRSEPSPLRIVDAPQQQAE